MSELLDQWQARMEAHFQALGNARSGSGYPVFALEHGLSDGEFAEIAALLRDRLRTNNQLMKHWLLWAIYATEQGYSYSGNEYWQSYEEDTPFWQGSDRNRLPAWFRRFQDRYDAVVPTGPWASHFRIIAWPITHAILPKYLQHQFARALWELRYRLASLVTFDAQAVGHMMALHAHGSNRFHDFLQQEELTGRIVLALLGENAPGGVAPINPPTLDRIVRDLEHVRHGREWLKEARQVVRDRFTGIGRGSGPLVPRQGADAGRRAYSPQQSIKPSVLLRSAGAGEWTPLLDIPDFRAIAINTAARDFLRTTRVQLAGTDDMKPAGWLLGARRKAVLQSWPRAGERLVDFERPQGLIDHILSTDCVMSNATNWLFRIGADGNAREILGRIVRPGGAYLLVGPAAMRPFGWVTDARLSCTGAEIRRLAIPSDLSRDDLEFLRGLGLQVAKTIRVWPAGLPGRGWDGEGRSEWLTTESPCFGLVHDHPVEGYSISVNGGPEMSVAAGVVGFPTFLRMPPLPAGVHHLNARAVRSRFGPQTDTAPDAEGYLVLHVRDPEPWRPGRSFHAGLVVNTDPIDADLDIFWANDLELSILGPDGRQVRCGVSLSRGDGTELLSEQVGEPLSLPVTPATWRRHFQRFVSDDRRAHIFLEATTGCLSIQGDELGEFRLPFERNVLPLRWLLRQAGEIVSVRLADDSGREDRRPRAFFSSFERPLMAVELPMTDLETEMAVPIPGGLLTGELDELRDAVVVSSGRRSTGLDGLGVVPTFPELENGSATWTQAFETIDRWNAARLAGAFADVRRQQIVNSLVKSLYRHICGRPWLQAEERYVSNPGSSTVEQLKHAVGKFPGFAAVLVRDYDRLNNFTAGAAWFADRARHHLGANEELGQAALRLASDPCRYAFAERDRLDTLIADMQASPDLLRGARLVALLCANPSGSSRMNEFPRWSW